ncbi:thioredoxin family protein [Streptomyces sp. NPDC048385]|uniref:thioredoxin family protein n=1 Tax=unclassified Streptomyces TaxID=2593676 RepID=UPI00341B875E
MRITLLTVPGCPNAPLIHQRITQALDGRHAEIEQIEVITTEQAEKLGMTGSPTLLVDGTDPFAVPEDQPSISCRLYRSADGTIDGAPSVAALRDALAAA